MIYGSVCSGIETASVAWEPLGWRPAWFAEIENFPSEVLRARWPGVANRGDFTRIGAADDGEAERGSIDVLVGGTPCQSFSVAGLRGGLADGRGNLALEFLRLAGRLRPRWLLWENVPGVLSSNGGRDFGAFLGGLELCGYGWAYRTLDAQFVRVDGLERAVPQRRRRVFVVGRLGDLGGPGDPGQARDARGAALLSCAVLFEPESLRGHPAPRRQAGTDPARTLTSGTRKSGGFRGEGTDENLIAFRANASFAEESFDICGSLQAENPHAIAHTEAVACPLTGNPYGDHAAREGLLVAHSLTGEGHDGCEATARSAEDGTGRGVPLVFEPRFARNDRGAPDVVCPPLKAQSGQTGKGDAAPCVAFAENSRAELRLEGGDGPAVRRLTPIEWERLMGLPDDYTRIAWRGRPASACPDGPRYKAIGNGMAGNVMRWIGRRIDAVDQMILRQAQDEGGGRRDPSVPDPPHPEPVEGSLASGAERP